MNTIQEDILKKFKKSLTQEDLEKVKYKDSNSNKSLKIGIFLIIIATFITILRTISSSLIETNFYILTFWPTLIIGSILIIITVWFKNNFNPIEIQKNLIDKDFDVYNLIENESFEYIQEFGNLLFEDIDNFLHSDKELIIILRNIFHLDNELKILSKNGLTNKLTYNFRNEIKINNESFYLYKKLYGYITKEQKILIERLKDLLEEFNSEESPNKRLLIKNEIHFLQKGINLPIEILFENI